MVDPISLVSALETAANLGRLIFDYVKEVKNVPDILVQISAQAAYWRLHLEALHSLEQHGNITNQLKEFLQPTGALGEAQDCLEQLEALVQDAPRPNAKFLESFKRFTWPITSKNHAEELLRRLDCQSDTLQLAMSTASKQVIFRVSSFQD